MYVYLDSILYLLIFPFVKFLKITAFFLNSYKDLNRSKKVGRYEVPILFNQAC